VGAALFDWLASAKLCRATGTTGSKTKANSAAPTPTEIVYRGNRTLILLSWASLGRRVMPKIR
jgi:hypothetical protein